MLYATRTGTLRNIAELERNGIGMLLTPHARWIPAGWDGPIALDNGAWGSFQRKVVWNPDAFMSLLDANAACADWAAIPDVVAGGAESLALSVKWMSTVLDKCRLALLPVQDGMVDRDVASLLGPRVGIFLGGSTEWKCATMRAWGSLARRVGCYYHVARVNTRRRIRAAEAAGANSIDGTSASQYSVNAAKIAGWIDGAERQAVMEF